MTCLCLRVHGMRHRPRQALLVIFDYTDESAPSVFSVKRVHTIDYRLGELNGLLL